MLIAKSELRSVITAQGAMILNIEADEISTLNELGGYIWGLLLEGKSTDQVVADLARETGADVSVIAADVNEFLEQLAAKKIVTL
ncbi:PqqD family protein [Acidicapsa ligni]|uniref:PqqD family protein n=1 Tax=Acidicapsa ligni TaxID=542300 RepID=UPI0021DF6219|nr:PqqD family protein [Acidicapsa ligni]